MAGHGDKAALDKVVAQRQRGQHIAELKTGALPSTDSLLGQSGGLPSSDSLIAPHVSTGKKTGGHGGRGLLGTIGHAVAQTGSDLKNVALSAPAGLFGLGKLEYNAIKHDVQHPALGKHESLHDFLHGSNNPASHKLGQVEAAQARQIGQDLSHPLRHPGYTLLDVLPGVNAAGKLAEAGRLAKAGESLGTVAKAATVGVAPEPRVLKVGGLEARGHYSRAAGARVVQRAADSALQKGAEKNVAVSVGSHELSAERMLHGRAAKWMARNERVADATARAKGTRLQKIGEKLQPEELRALRLVAEEVPVERRLAAQQLRKASAKTVKEQARHEDRISVTQKAMQYLDEGPNGKPVFKASATKLQKVYGALKEASADREQMLKNVGVMDDASLSAAKTKAARIAAGAKTVGGELVGAEDVTASPDAVHIGNPVERTKLAGKPKVSSSSTFGHTRKPSSLKTATGGSVEHALERNDVTNIVAERHAEAVRLSKIDRVRTTLAKAGSAVPKHHDDVFLWTDKLTKNERIPVEVRKYLDNPESVAHLPEADRVALSEKIRQAVFQQHNWKADPEARQQFEKLATQKKGVFIPRKLAGEYAKRDVTLPGSHFIDAVNNAQKAGLIYLKLNYPVVQGLSNVAMSIIHQGFAAPKRLTQAVMLDRAIGPDLAGVLDDIMGQGAVLQAALEGQGTVARASQALAHTMSAGVDKPARRAAFLHEAAAAGYNTGDRVTKLLTDDRHAHDLAEVAQRAKESIVDYGELGPAERAIVRRLIFVYPWQKGATKYAAHFLRDHPVQAAALSSAGDIGHRESDAKLGPVPSYLNGVFDVGGGLVNPSGLNFFQTPAQIGEAVAGTATGNPAQTGSGLGFLSPAPALIAGLLSGRDDIGRPLKGNVLAKARDLTVGQTAAASLALALSHGHTGTVLGGRPPSKTFPGGNDAYWKFILGGLYPRQYDKGALNKNAALEKVPGR